MDKFQAEETNLLSQALADLPGNEFYVETALLNPEEKEILGLIEGIQKLSFFSDSFKKFCVDLKPFFNALGIGKLALSELTALGLKVGHKNKTEINENDEE